MGFQVGGGRTPLYLLANFDSEPLVDDAISAILLNASGVLAGIGFEIVVDITVVVSCRIAIYQNLDGARG